MKVKELEDVKFYPEKRKNKDGIIIETNVPIMAAFSYEGKRFQYYTGEWIDLEKWDYDRQRPKRNIVHNGRNSSKIRAELDKIASHIYNIYYEYKNAEKPLPKPVFRKELKERRGEPETKASDTLSVLTNKFIETSGDGQEWTISTVKKIKTNLKHLKTALGDIQVRDIDANVFHNMENYFHNEGMVNNTIKKNLKMIKWFLRWCIRHGYITGKPATDILNYNPKLADISEAQRQKKNLIALTKDEIKALEDLKIPETKQYLHRIRDVFLFQCYTGLRYSDIYPLTKYNIIQKDGKAWLSLTTVKDREFIEYKLIPQAKRIIDKYKDLPGEKALPVVTNQRMNEYLKELGALAELNTPIVKIDYKRKKKIETSYPKWQLLTTHVGRKTFITTAVEAGVSMDELMRIVGHSDFEMLKVYYTVRDERLSNAMDKIGGYYG